MTLDLSFLDAPAPTPPDDALGAALWYAARGWRVFPLAEGKVPTGERDEQGRGGFYVATTDPEKIRAWWSEHPSANVAVYLAGSGLVAVDVDVSGGKPGLETYNSAARELGPLPAACCARTGSGGLHFLMRAPETDRRPRGRLDKRFGSCVDVKVNGYVAVHPSVNSRGQPYRWVACGDPPPVPAAWVDALYHDSGFGGERADVADWEESSHAVLDPADAAGLREALRKLGPRAGGNHTTFRAIRTVHHDYGLSVDEGAPFLEEWNSKSGQPHLGHALARAVERAAEVPCEGSRGAARRAIPWQERVRLAREPDDVGDPPALPPRPRSPMELLDGLSVPSAVAASVAAPGSYAALLAQASDDVARYRGMRVGEREEEPYFRPARELEKPYAPTPWLVRGLVLDSGWCVVGGTPKISKTWVMTELAVAVATGTPAFGAFDVPRAGLALYFYTEDVERSVRNRVRAVMKGRGLEGYPDRLWYQPQGRQIRLSGGDADAHAARLIASARYAALLAGEPVALLALDPLRNVHSAKENESDDMIEVAGTLRMVALLVGDGGRPCPIATPHHMKKPDRSGRSAQSRPGEDLRGSSAIWGAIDSGIYLEEAEGGDGEKKFCTRVASQVKAAKSAGAFDLALEIRDDAGDEAVEARWQKVPRGAAAQGPATWDEVARRGLDRLYQAEVRKAPIRTKSDLHEVVKGNRGAFFAAMLSAEAEGWIAVSGKSGVLRLTPAGRAIAEERAGVPAAAPDGSGE